MHEATVICNFFIGDSLFASSAAEQLKRQNMYDKVNLHVKYPQPLELLQENPFIDDVRIIGTRFTTGDVYTIPAATFVETPPIEFQRACGVPNPVNSYTVHVPAAAARIAEADIDRLSAAHLYTPIIAVQSNWLERTFLFTKEEYDRGINVPNLGYGGRRRNIAHILEGLQDCVLVPVGLENGVTQNDPLTSVASYTRDAALIQQCDFFIGGEGGMSNLAAGVGTKCIITTDFIAQLYGPNGLFKKIADPQLGPAKLFPNAGHIHIEPFATDDEVIENIHSIVWNEQAIESFDPTKI